MRNRSSCTWQQWRSSTWESGLRSIPPGERTIAQRANTDPAKSSGRTPKVDKRRTEGGTRRKISTTSLGIVRYEQFCSATGVLPTRLGRGLTVTPLDETAATCQGPTS